MFVAALHLVSSLDCRLLLVHRAVCIGLLKCTTTTRRKTIGNHWKRIQTPTAIQLSPSPSQYSL